MINDHSGRDCCRVSRVTVVARQVDPFPYLHRLAARTVHPQLYVHCPDPLSPPHRHGCRPKSKSALTYIRTSARLLLSSPNTHGPTHSTFLQIGSRATRPLRSPAACCNTYPPLPLPSTAVLPVCMPHLCADVCSLRQSALSPARPMPGHPAQGSHRPTCAAAGTGLRWPIARRPSITYTRMRRRALATTPR